MDSPADEETPNINFSETPDLDFAASEDVQEASNRSTELQDVDIDDMDEPDQYVEPEDDDPEADVDDTGNYSQQP